MKAMAYGLFILVATVAVSSPSQAIELVHVIEGRTATVELSSTQPTLLRVENGRLRTVRAEGQHVRVEPDRARGEAILTIHPGAPRSITLFVSTEKVSFPMVVVPVDKPASTIVLREEVGQPERQVAVRALPSAQPHIRQVKSLILAAAAERPSADVQVKHVNQPIRLWAEVQVLHRRSLFAHGYSVDHWVITNVTPNTMSLDEQELFMRGVAAVAIERHHLASGESTAAYIVRVPEATP